MSALGLGESAAPVFHRSLPPLQLGAAAVVTAAFALLPDIDEPGSSVAGKLGPLSRAVARVTRLVAGGHRQATHSILFAAAVGAALAYLSRFSFTGPVVLAASLALTIGMLVPARLVRKGSVVALTAPIAAGWWAWRSQNGSWLAGPGPAHRSAWVWLPLAAFAGVMAHLVGDLVTEKGIPLFWPWGRHLAVPILGRTRSWREAWVGLALSVTLSILTWLDIVVPLLRRAA